jgi:threonine/homoserine/homoserine lactone efflux protein
VTFEENSSLFKQGFLTGISNPKDLLFFAALFPAFLNEQQPLLMQLVILMTTWSVVDYMIKVVYVLMGKKINSKFSSPSFLKVCNRLTGGIFIGLGFYWPVLALRNE